VNLASRIEAHSLRGQVLLSEHSLEFTSIDPYGQEAVRQYVDQAIA